MIDEITKNVNIVLNILATIGFFFLVILISHFVSPYAYFTPKFMHDLPFLIAGVGVGYFGRQLYLNYKSKNDE